MKKSNRNEQIQNLKKKQIKEIRQKGAVIEDSTDHEQGMMRMDLHCHTEASWDCITPLERFPRRLIEQGISVQAITDHNEIWGAQKLQKIVKNKGYELTIIIGEEILTSEGEIIGLFLKEKIEKGLSPEETISQIKKQGGISILPHGFDPLKRYRLSDQARDRVEASLNVVETFNTRVSRKKWNRAAVNYSSSKNKLMSAGSDAHTLKDVGTAWVEVPRQEIKTPQALLKALEGGVPTGTWVNPLQSLVYRGWDVFRNTVLSFRKATSDN